MSRMRVRWVLVFLLIAILTGCAGAPNTRERSNLESTVEPVSGHCEDPQRAQQLRAMGPVYAIGASVSHGLFATSFPTWIREQMCLQNDEYEEDYFFLFFLKSDARILRHLRNLRPRIVVALDFPYHYVKLQYAERAKATLRHYLTMLLMDCRNDEIDCSEGGDFHFVRRDSFHPAVLTGSIYFDCSDDEQADPGLRVFPDRATCREENVKLNDYLYELAREFPRLHVLPIYRMVMALHHTRKGTYPYRVNGVNVEFSKNDMFVDGFHPWTNPGSYVLANLVIDRINRDVVPGMKGGVPIPYLPLEFRTTPP